MTITVRGETRGASTAQEIWASRHDAQLVAANSSEFPDDLDATASFLTEVLWIRDRA